MTISRGRPARAALGLAAPLLLAGVAACSAAQSAASNASSSARQAAQDTAKDVAVRAFRLQACAMTADGALSSAEVRRLRGELDAAAAAGLPQEVVSALRPVLAQAGAASSGEMKKQVQKAHDAACSG